MRSRVSSSGTKSLFVLNLPGIADSLEYREVLHQEYVLSFSFDDNHPTEANSIDLPFHLLNIGALFLAIVYLRLTIFKS